MTVIEHDPRAGVKAEAFLLANHSGPGELAAAAAAPEGVEAEQDLGPAPVRAGDEEDDPGERVAAGAVLPLPEEEEGGGGGRRGDEGLGRGEGGGGGEGERGEAGVEGEGGVGVHEGEGEGVGVVEDGGDGWGLGEGEVGDGQLGGLDDHHESSRGDW